MVELREADVSFKRLNAAVTVILCGTVVGIAYWYERFYRRWAEQNHPFAVPRARLELMRTNYGERREFVSEITQVFSRLLGEVARGDDDGSRRSGHRG
jgi:hypothetical protein